MKQEHKYSEELPLQEKIYYVLHLMEAANTQDLVAQIAELDGLAAEEAFARLHVEVETLLPALEEQGTIERLPVHGKRYKLAASANE